MMLAIMFLSSMTLTSVIMLLIFSISMKSNMDSEKISPFECGFSPKSNSRINFSLQFFLVTLIFLIFDVELILMFPFLGSLISSSIIFSSLSLMMFVFILSLGLFWEWNQSMLEWTL